GLGLVLAAPAASRSSRATTRTTASPSGPARPSLRLGPCFVHDEVAVAEQPSIEHLDGLGSFLLGGHFDESKPPRPAGELIRNDTDRLDGSCLGEQLPEILFRSLEGEIADEQLCWHREPPAAIRTEWSLSPAHRRLWGCLLDRELDMPGAADSPPALHYGTDAPDGCQAIVQENFFYFTKLCRAGNTGGRTRRSREWSKRREKGTSRRASRRACAFPGADPSSARRFGSAAAVRPPLTAP